MNCANHPDVEKVAFCRTCGKPLCAQCTRDVRGVIYCENCLADRLAGVQPQQTVYQQVMDQGLGPKVPPTMGSGPNPGLAGVLGAIPFGVGAVYCGQYVKGLVHLGIFAFLVVAVNSDIPDYLHVLFSLSIAFFWIYQIVDSVRSAKAIQMGLPAPDPFGLANTFGTGEKMDMSKVPMGAVVLIGLGILFLLHNMGFRFFSMERFWPLILIGIGAWLFARRWGVFGQTDQACDCAQCRARCLMGPSVLITVGMLFLLQAYGASIGRTWPALLLVIGLIKLLQSNASSAGHIELPPPGYPPAAGGVVSGEVQPPSTEVNNG